MAALFRIAAAPEKGARSFKVKVGASAQGEIEKTEQSLQRLPEGETVVTPVQPAADEGPQAIALTKPRAEKLRDFRAGRKFVWEKRAPMESSADGDGTGLRPGDTR